MEPYISYLDQIDNQKERLLPQLESWVNINSHSENLSGLNSMANVLQRDFRILGGDTQRLPLPQAMVWDMQGASHKIQLGDIISIRKRPSAPFKVLLCGHMDTVYPINDKFQEGELINSQTYRGPGAADMKGGLLIMLKALEILESSTYADTIGWEVLITPDEEIGSLGSRFMLVESAQRNNIGLVFEPSFPDGALASDRKGSAVFTVVARGTSAHAGRDFHLGRNAISSLARVIVEAENYMKDHPGVFINIGKIEGGLASNIVADHAACLINVRVNTKEQVDEVYSLLTHLLQKENKIQGLNLTLHEQSDRPPKPFDENTRALFEALSECAELIGRGLESRPTGGVCDGNYLSAAGLPTIDTLGAIGGNLHTSQEYIVVDSLWQRARLTALFLLRLAKGDILLNGVTNV